jgi:hypothetical protein
MTIYHTPARDERTGGDAERVLRLLMIEALQPPFDDPGIYTWNVNQPWTAATPTTSAS